MQDGFQGCRGRNSLNTSEKDTKGVKRKLNGLKAESLKTKPFCSLTACYCEKLVSLSEIMPIRPEEGFGAAFGLGNRVSGHSGFVDQFGKFHPRTDYQPPVRIDRGLIKSAWEGTKRIAQFGFDLATFKLKTTVWTGRDGMLKDTNGKNMKDVSRFGLFEEEYHGSTALNKVEVTERFFGLYRSSSINGQEIKDGHAIYRDSKGKMRVLDPDDPNFKDNFKSGRTVLSVSGMNNDITGNVDMHFASRQEAAINQNQESVHIFNDTGRIPFFNIAGELLNYGTHILTGGSVQLEPSVGTVKKMIEAGAFSNGGVIMAHSQGAQIVTQGIINSKTEIPIKSNVFLFGGAHNDLPEKRLSGGARMIAFENNDLIPSGTGAWIPDTSLVSVTPTFNERIYNQQNPTETRVINRGAKASFTEGTNWRATSFKDANTFERKYFTAEDLKRLKHYGNETSWGHGYNDGYKGYLQWYLDRAGIKAEN
jgi:hypothetical protein